MSEFTITSATGQRMLDLLPSYYEKVRETRVVMEAEGKEFDLLSADASNVLNQFFVETATWGLDRWESELGLPTYQNKPIDQRRSVIKSKLLGVGTVTKGMIQRVAESYDHGEVDVYQEDALYTVFVHFISTRGIPPNLSDIQKAIQEISPAHLAIHFKFTYLTWDELDGLDLRWDGLKELDLTWNEFEVYGGYSEPNGICLRGAE